VFGIGFLEDRRAAQASRIQRLGVEAQQAGRAEDAVALYWQALEVDPTNAGALGSLGLYAIGQERYAAAESLFKAMLEHHGRDKVLAAGAHYNLGESLLRTGAIDAAIENFRASFTLDSANAEIYNNLGWALVRSGQAAEARALLDRGLARFPGVAALHKNAGMAALHQGDEAAAVGYLNRALQLNPALEEAQQLRAQALGATGVPDTPTRELSRSPALEPSSVGLTPQVPRAPAPPRVARPDSL
jgi:tetratricopeptide (TPR) repeat protein